MSLKVIIVNVTCCYSVVNRFLCTLCMQCLGDNK